MRLYSDPFEKIRNKEKTIELRLNDEKRRKIRVGDTICFHRYDREYDVIICTVTDLYRFKDFEELYTSLPLDKCGYTKDQLKDAKAKDMLEYYSLEEQNEYGVLGIGIEKLDQDYLCDCHMHLEYGNLSKEYVMEFVDEAVRKGLHEIDILDHSHRFKEFEPCYKHLKIYEKQKQWLAQPTKFQNTLDEYMELIKKMKQVDLPIKVKFGLEVCYTKDTEKMIREILSGYRFDFLTGAVHSINSILYDMPFSGELLWDRYLADQIYRDYYEAVINCIDSGLFDRLAHPDTIKMFRIYPDYDLTETYCKLAESLKKQDMLTEINTGCRYRYDHPDIGLSEELIDIFKEEGVQLITGSDAHKPADVGIFIKEATQRMK